MNLKTTILACLTFLAGIVIIITYASQQDRYAIFSQDKAIFVFDRKNATLNYCTANSCQLITPYVGAGESSGMLAGLPPQMAIIAGGPVMQPAPQQQGAVQTAPIVQPVSSPVSPQSSLQTSPVPAGMQPQQVVLTPTPAPAATAAAAKDAAAPAKDAEKPADDDNKDSSSDDSDSSKDDSSSEKDESSDSDNG